MRKLLRKVAVVVLEHLTEERDALIERAEDAESDLGREIQRADKMGARAEEAEAIAATRCAETAKLILEVNGLKNSLRNAELSLRNAGLDNTALDFS